MHIASGRAPLAQDRDPPLNSVAIDSRGTIMLPTLLPAATFAIANAIRSYRRSLGLGRDRANRGQFISKRRPVRR